MKIVLLMPRGALYRKHQGIFRRPIRYAPLTLTTLASLVPEEINAEVEIYDEGVETIPDNIEADLVGITAITGTAMRAYAIADKLRLKGIPVVIGGVHATLVPNEALLHADSVVTGFAEESWPRLLRDFYSGKMQRLYVQSQAISMEKLPIPKRSLWNKKEKSFVSIDSVQATRGCTNNCDFCIVPVAWGRRMYLRPVKDVIQELEQIESRNILFVDVSPIEDKRYAKELYSAMIPLKKRWVSPSTIKIADDDDLLDTAAKSGCKGLLIGFESVSQGTLQVMGKNFNAVEKYKTQVKRLHNRGIAVQACFVFGFDTDDKDIFAKTTDLVYKLNLDLPRYTVYTPFPGTPAFKKLKNENRILKEDWSFYDAQHVVFKPLRMTELELQEGLFWAWKQTYSIGSIAKRLAGARCLLDFTIPANFAYRHYARGLSGFDDIAISAQFL